MIACSFFRNAQDNAPKAWEGSWPELMERLSQVHRPSPAGGKKSLPAVSGASYPPGATRSRSNVRGVQLLCLDFDNSTEHPTGAFHLDREGAPTNRPVMEKRPLDQQVQPEAVLERLRSAGVAAFLWTTWSWCQDWQKFRALVPLLHPIPGADLWPQAAEFALERLGLVGTMREALDLGHLHNAAALSFLPGAPEGQEVRLELLEGQPLEIPAEGLERVQVPARPAQPWQRVILQQRQREGRSWAARFRNDEGEFLDLTQLDAIALLKGLGCQVGASRPWKGGTKYRTTCPWPGEHSHGLDDDCGVLFMNPGLWPTWSCSHKGHSHLGLRDLLESAGCLHA